jgi:hypothetical protein
MGSKLRKNNPNDRAKEPHPKPSKPGEEIDEAKEAAYDKTLADSFPASDPPSSIPNPDDEESAA